MNELQFGNKIRRVLDQGTRLDARTRERLRAARERALARHDPESRAPWTSSLLAQFGGYAGLTARLVLPVLVLAVSLGAIGHWHQTQRAVEADEIDVQLLTDDLPIDAYLDKGFETWLKSKG